MAKRVQDSQLTRDSYDAAEQIGDDDEGRGRQVDPAKTATTEQMMKRTIKQPKSRLAGVTTPRPQASQPPFMFNNDATSTTPATPAPTANGSSDGFSFGFGNTPATPAPRSAFAGFSALNGGVPTTPATPAEESSIKSNPFASLNSTTPAGKPPVGLFGSTTPAGEPTFSESVFKYPAIEQKKDQTRDTAMMKPTFGGVSDLKFASPVAKKDEAKSKPTFGGVSTFGPATNCVGDVSQPKPTFGGMSTFNFPEPAAKKDDDIGKPKPTFAGVSTFQVPGLVAKNDGDASKANPTFGGVSTFNFPEPAAKKDDETGKPIPTFGGVSVFNFPQPAAARDDAGKAQPTFGGVSLSNIFQNKDHEGKDVQDKSVNSFAGILGPGPRGGNTPASTPAKPAAVTSTPAPVSRGLFGRVSSTESVGLFGTDAKIGDEKKFDGGIFESTPISVNKPESSNLASGGLFGAKAPITSNATSDTREVNYPALSPAPTTTTFSSVTTNGNTASINSNQAPPPPEDLTEAQKVEFDRQCKLRTLNVTLVQALQDADVDTADLRDVFREYERLYENIIHGTKRKDESQANGTNFSPKRPKPDESKPAASSAASIFGAIVDKNTRQPAAPATNESQLKSSFSGTSPQLKHTSTPVKHGFNFPQNPFPTPAPVAINPSTTPAIPPKQISNVFGAGGGAAVSGTTPSGGLFADLKPILRDQKDKGEEDSPEKPKSGGLFFGNKPVEFTAPPPQFGLKAGSTAVPEKPSVGLFGTPKAGSDQTWKPEAGFKFSAPSSEALGSQNSTDTSQSQVFNFNSQDTTASTAPSEEAPKAPFSFTGNISLAPPTSTNPSFDGVTGSDVSTPGAASDTSATVSTTGTASKSNEPSDEIHADKTDMSGAGPGEENEDVLYSVRVAVYVKDDKGAMKKIAVGASRVLKDRDSQMSRFLVRTEQGKVAVNVRLQKEVQYTPVPDKKVMLIPDFSGQKPKVYMVRMKESSSVTELGNAIAEAKG